jgi:hypothetical protein
MPSGTSVADDGSNSAVGSGATPPGIVLPPAAGSEETLVIVGRVGGIFRNFDGGPGGTSSFTTH